MSMNDSDANLNKFIIFDVIDESSSKMTNDVIDNHPHTFILIRMNKCGPCEATIPEWKKMCEVIEKKYFFQRIIDVRKNYRSDLEMLLSK